MIDILLFVLGLLFIYIGVRRFSISGRAAMMNDTSKMYFSDEVHLLNHGPFVDRGMVEKDGKLVPQSRPSSSFIRSIT